MDPVPEIKKATRKRLTIAQKLGIADLLDSGHCAAAIKLWRLNAKCSDALSYLRSAKRAFLTHETRQRPNTEQAEVNYCTEGMKIDVTTSPINAVSQ